MLSLEKRHGDNQTTIECRFKEIGDDDREERLQTGDVGSTQSIVCRWFCCFVNFKLKIPKV